MAKLLNRLLFKYPLKQTVQNTPLSRMFHISASKLIKVGEPIPSVELYEGNPSNVINIAEFCKDRKIVIFGVPGAFTPGCSRTHLPGYIERHADFKKKGVDEIVCVAVNDVFVMEAWGKIYDASGKVRMFADPNAVFAKALGLEMNFPKLGGIRSKRFAMFVKKGIVSILNVEPDSVGLTCSLATNLKISM